MKNNFSDSNEFTDYDNEINFLLYLLEKIDKKGKCSKDFTFYFLQRFKRNNSEITHENLDKDIQDKIIKEDRIIIAELKKFDLQDLKGLCRNGEMNKTRRLSDVANEISKFLE